LTFNCENLHNISHHFFFTFLGTAFRILNTSKKF